MTDFFKTFWRIVIRVWNYILWEMHHEPITVKKLVIAALVIVIGFYIAKKVRLLLVRFLSKKNLYSKHAISAFEKVVFYFVLVTFVFLALRIVHLPLTTFAFLGGAVAVGVGFGAQNIINNFISGFIIMTERPVKIGDVVEVDGEVGTIEDIGARCTHMLTCSNIHKLIPNSVILEKTVTNWTHADEKIRMSVTIGIAYGSDVNKAAEVMKEAVCKCEGIILQPEPLVLFRSHGDSTLNFEVFFWGRVCNLTQRMTFESKVNFLLNEHLQAADIEIAFPQLDVHLTTNTPGQTKI